MSIKKVVAIVLPIGLFVGGTIILFGLLSAKIFSIYQFIFTAAILLIIIISARKLLSKKDLAFLTIAALIFSASLATFLGGVRDYHDSTQNKNAVELNSLMSLNQYYSDYVDYLNAQIDEYKAESVVLSAKIVSQKNLQTTPLYNQILQDDEKMEREFEGDEYDGDD